MPKPTMSTASSRVGLRLLAGVGLLALCGATATQAALTIEPMAGYNLVVDSNITAPSTYGPKAATLGAKICTDADIQDVIVYIGDHTNGTPGIYPVTDSTAGNQPTGWGSDFLNNTGEYSFTHEGGSAGLGDATRWLGDMEAGECRVAYWLVSYPQCANVLEDGVYVPQNPHCDTSVTGGGDLGGSIKPDDDLFISYDIWATGSGGTADNTSRTMTMRNEISASANKIWPNTTSKVPDEYIDAIQNAAPVACLQSGVSSDLGWDTLDPNGDPVSDAGVYPGEWVVTTEGIWYDFGNVGAGFDNDGDLVPDRNAWAQPVGDPASWDAGCFRLVNTCGVVIVKLNDGTEQIIPFEDQLYFENLPDNNRGAVGLVFYQYMGTGLNCSASLTPYQEVASGFDNEKFSADFGAALGISTDPFDASKDFGFAKTADTSALPTITYTLTGTNDTEVNLGAPDYGVPLMFVESIPDGTTYEAATADTAANTVTWASATAAVDSSGVYVTADDPVEVGDIGTYLSSYDAAGTTRYCYRVTSDPVWKVLYSTDNGNSWLTSEPAIAADVTDIKWLLFTDIGVEESTNIFADGLPADCPSYDAADETADYADTEKRSLANGQKMEISFDVDATGSDLVCNSADISLSGGSSLKDATNCIVAAGDNYIIGTVFEDDGGTTGALANGVQDGDEAGIDGVTVWLYYDGNGDGDADDEEDFLLSDWTATTSLSTEADLDGDGTSDGIGAYLFGNPGDAVCDTGETCLPDGNYVVVVDYEDGDIPATYTYSTPIKRSVDLDADGAITTTVAKTVNFGFSPALDLTKNLHTAGDIYEGDLVTFQLGVSNVLPGDGEGGTACTYTIWAGSASADQNGFAPSGGPANAKWQLPDNALGAPDNNYAYTVMSDNTDKLGLGSFATGDLGGTITSVKYRIISREKVALADAESLEFALYYRTTGSGTGSDETTSIVGPTEFTGSGTFTEQVGTIYTLEGTIWNGSTGYTPPVATGLSAAGWDFDDFTNNLVGMQVIGNKAGGGTGDLEVDAAAFVITTDQECGGNATILDPVPLTDTFEDADLEFVSASVPVTSISDGTDADTDDDTLTWDNVGPLYPGQTKNILVTFRALAVTSDTSTTNYTNVTDAQYIDGEPAGSRSDNAPVTILDGIGTGSLSGRVWNDNGGTTGTADDGSQDGDEAGIQGVRVELYACKSITSGALITDSGNIGSCADEGGNWVLVGIDETDVSGDYSFTPLREGFYYTLVDETTLPSSANQTGDPNESGQCSDCDGRSDTSDVDLDGDSLGNLSPETAVSGINYGYNATITPGLSIGDTLFYDWDGDGKQDSGTDGGIPNITVYLYDSTGALVDTQLTDSSGRYLFSGLSSGIYTVRVDTADSDFPSGITQTYDPDDGVQGTVCSNCDSEASVALDATSIDTIDFGYQPADGTPGLVSIGDLVYFDVDGNGTRDIGEPGIENVTMELCTFTDTDGDRRYDPGETLNDPGETLNCTGGVTTTTDANGYYAFTSLAAGNYVVRVAGSNFTDGSGTLDEATFTADPEADGGTFSDSGLFGTDCSSLDDDNLPNAGGNAACDAYSGRVLAAGENYLGADFGFQLNSVAISGTVWADTDGDTLYWDDGASGDGVRDYRDIDGDGLLDYESMLEEGMAGVTVTLLQDTDGDNVYETTVNTTTTDADGGYSFTTDSSGNALASGDYQVVVTSGDVSSYTAYCDRPDTPLNADTCSTGATLDHAVTIDDDLNTIQTHVDFGYQLTLGGSYTLSGTACVDDTSKNGYCGTTVNTDGSLATGETAYQSVTVTLFDSAGNRVRTTTTATDGTYSFTGLPNGDYTVVLDKPEDFVTLTTSAAATPATTVTASTDGDGNITAVRQVVSISGGNVAGVDYAFVAPAYDYGDLPESYSTLTNATGPGHMLPSGSATVWLGPVTPDGENDGVPGPNADGDGNDEDGVTVDLASAAYWAAGMGSGSVDVTVTTSAASGQGYVVGWIDFDKDGAFTGTDELIYSGWLAGTSGGTTHTITFDKSTTDTLRYDTYVRFRVAPEAFLLDNLAYKSTVSDGEVEDYKIPLYWDYGDLPTDEYASTDYADGGARHYVPSGGPKVYIGSSASIAAGTAQETDGQESDTAAGDTEEIVPIMTVVETGYAVAAVEVHNGYASKAAQLVGWADFNCDGDFTDSGEQSISDLDSSLTTDDDSRDFSAFEGDDDGTFATGNIPAGYDGIVTLRWNSVSVDETACAASPGWADSYGAGNSFLRLRITTHGNLAADGESTDPGNFGFFSDSSPQVDGPVGDGVVNDSNFDITPTYAVISSIRAYLLDGLPVIEWITTGESGTLGFDVERRDGAGGFQQLNDGLLPALIGTQQGGTYYLVDAGAVAGETYDYRLIEHEVKHSGKIKESKHGPYTVTVAAQTPMDVSISAVDLIAEDDFLSIAHVPSAEEQIRTEAGRQAAEAAKGRKKAKKSSDMAKLHVKETGLYQVTAEEIAALLHIDVREAKKQIRKYGYALTSQGRNVPYHAADDAGTLYFYNSGYESLYTDTNIFWLGLDKKTGVPMAVTSAVPERQTTGNSKGKGNGNGNGNGELPGPTGAETFQRTLVVEENRFAVTNGTYGAEEEFWVWEYLHTGISAYRVKDYDLSTPHTSIGEALLKVTLASWTKTSHRISAMLNGTAIGEVSWSGVAKETLEVHFDAALLEADNQLTLQAWQDGSAVSVVFVDRISVTYPSLYVADGDRLGFDGAEHPVIGIEGFGQAQIALVDVSSPGNPIWVQVQGTDLGDGSFGMMLQPETTNASYWAAAESRVYTAEDAWTDAPSQLKATDFSAGYIVIATEETFEAAQALADYRSAQFETLVVDVEDIMDEYADGLSNPKALRAFLSDAYTRWSQPPLFVVLAGGGSYDYKDYLGYGDSLIPPVLVETPYGLAASDSYLGDVIDDDGIPEIIVGRIPAVTNAELQAYVDKVVGYEFSGGEAWTRQVILAADDPDTAGEFSADIGDLRDLVTPDYTVNTLLLEDYPGWNWREPYNPWVDALNDGAAYFVYIGHGASDVLADEGMLVVWKDVTGANPPLANGARLPVAMFLTCTAANYAFPGFDSLGEALMLRPSGGAIATWGPTGLSLNSEAKVFGEGFFEETFQQGNRILGESVYRAHEAYGAGRYRFMHSIYNVLGDSALQMK